MPKETLKETLLRQDVLQEKLEVIVNALQPLSLEERLRVLNTVIVFFGLEEEI